jgi:hypothetical protein
MSETPLTAAPDGFKPFQQQAYLRRVLRDAVEFIGEPWPMERPGEDTPSLRRTWCERARGDGRIVRNPSDVAHPWAERFVVAMRVTIDWRLEGRLRRLEADSEPRRLALHIFLLALSEARGRSVVEQVNAPQADRERGAEDTVRSRGGLWELLANNLVADPETFTEVLAALRWVAEAIVEVDDSDSKASRNPEPKKSQSPPQTPLRPAEPIAGMTCREVAERLERLRGQGEPWTSYEKMRSRLGVPSKQTVYAAVQSTSELTAWAKRHAAPRAQQGTEGPVTDRTPQARELSPEDEATIREFIENADPDERAFVNEMAAATREFQLWYIDEPAEARRRHREHWKEHVESDPDTRTWFLGLSAQDQIAWFDDPDRHQRIMPRV